MKNREELRKERVEKGKEKLERIEKGWEDREGLGRIEKGWEGWRRVVKDRERRGG